MTPQEKVDYAARLLEEAEAEGVDVAWYITNNAGWGELSPSERRDSMRGSRRQLAELAELARYLRRVADEIDPSDVGQKI